MKAHCCTFVPIPNNRFFVVQRRLVRDLITLCTSAVRCLHVKKPTSPGKEPKLFQRGQRGHVDHFLPLT